MTAPLVVFGEDWGSHPSSTQHLAHRLMRERPLVWVNSIGLRRPSLNVRDLGRVGEKIGSAFFPGKTPKVTRLKPDTPDIVLAPLSIPVPRNRMERAMNRLLLGTRVRKAVGAISPEKPVFWASLPTAVDFVGCVNETAVVYYCGDDFSALAGVDSKQVSIAEEKLAERSDLIIVASEYLKNRFPSEKTVHIPHGVDTSMFSAPSLVPADLPGKGRVAGFYGSISEWLDIELLITVVRMLPEWKFVFIGPVQTEVAELSHCANVYFIGPREHEQLPDYIQNWTVSLMPFKDNAQIRACNPLKLREYMAAGRPIVTTDFPALDGYRDLVSVAKGARNFAEAISRASTESPSFIARRQQRVAEESWDNRADMISSLLASL